MIEPRRIGHYLTTDSAGYIQPDVAYEHIQEHWKLPLQMVVTSLMNSGIAHSVYLRGSVPRGLAIDHVSDLDIIYISDTANEQESEIKHTIMARFPFIREVELSRLSQKALNRIVPPRSRPYFHMLLKTQSLFLAGDDIVKEMPPFKPGLEMASHIFHLKDEFLQLRRRLEEERGEGGEQKIRQWFSRRLVRSGLEITMDASQKFTRDLYLCYEQFAEYYPDRADPMYSVLRNALNGHENPLLYEELVSFVDSKGNLFAGRLCQ